MEPTTNDAATLQAIIERLSSHSAEERERIFQTVLTFFNFHPAARPHPIAVSTKPQLSQSENLSAKEFLAEKEPHSDVERVTCLAYYLTHFRSQPHFKTIDISQLNTEAAQSKFSNAALAVNNSAKAGYLVPAVKGAKQISAFGEKYVLALPDRKAAADLRTKFSSKRSRKSSSQGKESNT